MKRSARAVALIGNGQLRRPLLLAAQQSYNQTRLHQRQAGVQHVDHERRSDHAESAGEDRDFYLSILDTTSTKREARSYIQRFTPPQTLPAIATDKPLLPSHHVEQSAFKSAGALIRHEEQDANRFPKGYAPLRKATLEGQAEPQKDSVLFVPEIAGEEIHVALVKVREAGEIPDATLLGVSRTLGQLRRLGLLTIIVVDQDPQSQNWRKEAATQADRIVAMIEEKRGKARRVDGALGVKEDGSLSVCMPNLLLAPLCRELITVLTPAAYNSSQQIVHADPYEIVGALTTLLSTQSLVSQPVSLDRIIFLDPLGGIPAPDRPAGAHVFVNLQQEYNDIQASLKEPEHVHHRRSLETIRNVLALLPSTASAVITTPEAAAAARLPQSHSNAKNPLIHNLLTDKPIFSSSLPAKKSLATQTTLIKHGIPLMLFPSGTRLTDPKIDLRKLVTLIEDSFGKELDVDHYLNRVNDHIAGLIIAGDYEGAAIVMWEHPPGGGERICYLDKFAVLRRSQGVGGVADVVFKAMTASVCPGGLFDGAEGVVWRSRRKNVVNKWYFERAKGTYKLKGAGDMWTMFWTTDDVEVAQRRFLDYVKVCESIEPSLRDNAG